MIDFIVLNNGGKFINPLENAEVFEINELKEISNLNLKKENLSVICESTDILSEKYVNSSIGIFNSYQTVGAIYSNYTFNNNSVYVPSFCRSRLVEGIYVPPVNCIVRNSILKKILIKGNSPNELFLKITDVFAMYHIGEFLFSKIDFYKYQLTEEDIKSLHEYFNSHS